ncbi:phospholipase A-2-activating protein isoform X1 [Hydra vulgaris]|uniref:phospholipase A-2-activating protein isoform X1 n=1 Tax=Hydra vulgaris TaxID=6087 RepID=UPI001F5F720B|nr:phospholipase A-2-activating protein [Hydra vulgaris]
MAYKLKSNLVGHKADVRAVIPSLYPPGSILSVSRDKSCRLWIPDNETNSFYEGNIFLGHLNYVASVCTIPASEKYPHGLIATGGNDKLILVFDFNSQEPIMRLEGHTGAVCALTAGKFGMLLSGSWDKTAKVWINGAVAMTLTGHEGAVWGIETIAELGIILTGSADKTIKMWRAGKCERTFSGHTDCVRDIVAIDKESFLSCSNDGSIRKWLLSGECHHIYKGHSNYVYSISVFPDCIEDFVSSGEDRAIKIWKGGDCVQTIILPCQSVWSVAVLNNGDIVAGSSDGMVRVFTCNESQYASPDIIKLFEEEVSNQAIPAAANLDLGEIKVDQLPGPEALSTHGVKKDQTKLIKRNGVVEAYQWDEINSRWQKIGEVTGAAGEDGSKRTEGKKMYKGKEYDFLFDVDIQEGKPPLKLPFNVTEDPWVVANKFLQDNDLSPMFLDEVAGFILKNTAGVTIGISSNQFADPFTGGSRYIPGTNSSTNISNGVDPFTGGARYVPETFKTNSDFTANQLGSNKILQGVSYIPERCYLKFTVGKSETIIAKIIEFNQQLQQEMRVNENEVQTLKDSITNLLNGKITLEKDTLNIITSSITKMLLWPHDKLLPVLDVFRILVLNENLAVLLLNEVCLEQLLSISRSSLFNNIMLVFRILTNAFIHPDTACMTFDRKNKILESWEILYRQMNKNVSISISSYVMNCCIYSYLNKSSFQEKIQLCTYINNFLKIEMDSEAMFRTVVALGTLLCDSEDVIAFAKSLEMHNVLAPILANSADLAKLQECCKVVMQILDNC